MKKMPLPSPRSPRALDEKILAYAKQHQPARRPYRPPLWLSGLATASIVVVTVIIALPTQQNVDSASPELSRPAASPAKRMSAPDERKERSLVRHELAAEAASAAAALPAIAADEAREPPQADSVQHRLKQLAIQLKNGDPAPARLDYQALRRECPECDLPATLEEALDQYTSASRPD